MLHPITQEAGTVDKRAATGGEEELQGGEQLLVVDMTPSGAATHGYFCWNRGSKKATSNTAGDEDDDLRCCIQRVVCWNRPAKKLHPHRPVLEFDDQASRFAGTGLLFCYNRQIFCCFGKVFHCDSLRRSILAGTGDVFCWNCISFLLLPVTVPFCC